MFIIHLWYTCRGEAGVPQVYNKYDKEIPEIEAMNY